MSIKITNPSPYEKILVRDLKVGETVFGYVLFSATRRQFAEPALYMRTWAESDRFELVDLADGQVWRGEKDQAIPLTIEGRRCDLEITVVDP